MTVYEALRAGVVDGSLIPGSGRVSESVLAQCLDVSRTPVREALQRLDAEGLVVANGRGVTARHLTTRELRDTYRTRAVLEGAAAESVAIAQASGLLRPVDLAGLRRLDKATDAATRARRFDEATDLNHRFHRRIAELADNATALALLDLLWDRIVVSTRDTLGPDRRTVQVDAEHRDIIVGIRSGEADTVRRAAIAHVLTTAELATGDDASHDHDHERHDHDQPPQEAQH